MLLSKAQDHRYGRTWSGDSATMQVKTLNRRNRRRGKRSGLVFSGSSAEVIFDLNGDTSLWIVAHIQSRYDGCGFTFDGSDEGVSQFHFTTIASNGVKNICEPAMLANMAAYRSSARSALITSLNISMDHFSNFSRRKSSRNTDVPRNNGRSIRGGTSVIRTCIRQLLPSSSEVSTNSTVPRFAKPETDSHVIPGLG